MEQNLENFKEFQEKNRISKIGLIFLYSMYKNMYFIPLLSLEKNKLHFY